jgi:hypothetical protein
VKAPGRRKGAPRAVVDPGNRLDEQHAHPALRLEASSPERKQEIAIVPLDSPSRCASMD